MGSFRFHQSFKLLPGLKLNVNKKSLSLTAGVRGAHATINTNNQRTLSAGLPGTGLSYRDTRQMGAKKAAPKAAAQTVAPEQPVSRQPLVEPAPVSYDVFTEVNHAQIRDIELTLLQADPPGEDPSWHLYVSDGTTDHWVNSFTDLFTANDAFVQWVLYAQGGGTVATWLKSTGWAS